MQLDLFGNPIGTSTPIVDILGQKHDSVAAMIEFWNDECDSVMALESPPHFFLRANPVTPTLAISERDESICSEILLFKIPFPSILAFF